MIEIGCTATRRGMSTPQFGTVSILLRQEHAAAGRIIAHHGCCVGGDAEFHRLARRLDAYIVGHPGPDWPNGPLCARVLCDFVEDPAPYMVRNQAIVDAVSRDEEAERGPGVMIAAPYESEPQPRGGTWGTIRMAMKALAAGKLGKLYVVGRDGELMDHTRWT